MGGEDVTCVHNVPAEGVVCETRPSPEESHLEIRASALEDVLPQTEFLSTYPVQTLCLSRTGSSFNEENNCRWRSYSGVKSYEGDPHRTSAVPSCRSHVLTRPFICGEDGEEAVSSTGCGQQQAACSSEQPSTACHQQQATCRSEQLYSSGEYG